jgi:glyoxylase-like metal-dependent hydrolase (beta-lactamase superfamily II)
VHGREESLLVDPSLGLWPRRDALPHVDRALLSHCHEDHVAGLPLFPTPSSMCTRRTGSGCARSTTSSRSTASRVGRGAVAARAGRAVPLRAAPDARGFTGERVFELGGGVRVRAIPAPGHTRGHCVILVEPDGALYLGDIDLSSFGPYYGDAWSSLADFEKSLALVREIEARTWITFHHIGVIDDRAAFLARLDRYRRGDPRPRGAARRVPRRAAQPRRDRRAPLRLPPGDAVSFADPVERRSMAQHLERLCAEGASSRRGGAGPLPRPRELIGDEARELRAATRCRHAPVRVVLAGRSRPGRGRARRARRRAGDRASARRARRRTPRAAAAASSRRACRDRSPPLRAPSSSIARETWVRGLHDHRELDAVRPARVDDRPSVASESNHARWLACGASSEQRHLAPHRFAR